MEAPLQHKGKAPMEYLSLSDESIHLMSPRHSSQRVFETQDNRKLSIHDSN